MESALLYIIIALGISILVNILFKRLGISQIIGYILTGTIIVYAFDLRQYSQSHTLELIGEFGIVFLMFTIGLEISLAKMNTMRKEIFVNGFLQVGITAAIFFMITHYFFNLDSRSSLIISLAFALSSTAVVLSYLKSSKEILTPYGQRSTGILIFQDIAVIPILILIGFLVSEGDESVYVILTDTILSAVIVVGLLFVVGKRVMSWLLHFSSSSNLEELFMASVLFIVMGASLLAHYMGFTYSLGAFVAGMIIAETKYHHKVESDIAPFKDILLGTFFVVVGMKIDVMLFVEHFWLIIGLFALVLVLKTIIIFGVLRLSATKQTSLKTALALSQVGEFSFVIFAVAGMGGLLNEGLSNLLVLVVIFSMVITPFFITQIRAIVAYFFKDEFSSADISNLPEKELKNHVIVCGYSTVGKTVIKYLEDLGANYVIIDNNPKFVREGLNKGKNIYLGDVSKSSILKALHVENASAVIVTLDNMDKKRLICEAILKHAIHVNLVVKVLSKQEREGLEDLEINKIVDGKAEIARLLVEETMRCSLNYKHPILKRL